MTLSLDRRAALWGDRLAVVDASADRRVSYADLESEADAMARKFTALGVGSGDAVAVVSRNRVEILASLFGVRRLGGVLAPISHRLTPATVGGPLESVSPTAVVHEAAQRDLVRELPDDLTYTFEELARIDGTDYDRPDRDPDDSLLYLHAMEQADRPAVGEDEGRNRPGESVNENPQAADRVVDVPERTVEWNCITAVAAWGLGKSDCAPALLPFSDTDGLHRLVLPLLYVGGRVVLLRAFDPDNTLGVVDEEAVTTIFAGATEYRELVASEAFETTDFGSIEWVGSRSALPTDVREALAQFAPVVRAYGSVETGPNNLYRPPETTTRGGECVGRPFPDCEARIVTSGEEVSDSGLTGETVPVSEGEVGELQFRGPVTARGYLTEDGSVETFPEWVSTGDLAFRESDDYYLLGRADEASESGVARVTPRKIERALGTREDVTAAGVIADAEGVLGAFVGDADPGELRTFLDEELSETVTLRELDRVESLPRRPTGELDRAALRRALGGRERIDGE